MITNWFSNRTQYIAYKNNSNDYTTIDVSEFEKYSQRGYVVETKIDEFNAEHTLILYSDSGNEFKFWAPWCDIYSELRTIEIVMNSEGLKIEF